MSRTRWTAIWTFHLKCHMVCFSVILLRYRITCLRFCNNICVIDYQVIRKECYLCGTLWISVQHLDEIHWRNDTVVFTSHWQGPLWWMSPITRMTLRVEVTAKQHKELKNIYLFTFREREKERKRYRNVQGTSIGLLYTPPTGDAPWWEWNLWPFRLQAGTQSTAPRQQGQNF